MSLLSQPSVPPPLPAQRESRRRSLRRAVQVECQVLSDLWEGQAPFLSSNLSPEGLWLQTSLPLERGEELLVTLSPPRWSEDEPLVALAQVARVGMYRRRSEPRASGMGLRFVDIEAAQRLALESCLLGLPPPLPSPARVARALAQHTAPATPVGDETLLTLDDGECFLWSAESELLTSSRPGRIQIAVPVQLVPTKPGAPASAKPRRKHRRVGGVARPRVTLRRPRLSLVPDLAS
jgi:hypothetical protein